MKIARESIVGKIKVRVGAHDAHYAGELVDGAKILQYFGDVATEILIRLDGDEGLFRAYEKIEFLAPVYAGDYLEIEAKLLKIGKTSRQMEFVAKKLIELEKRERKASSDLSESAAKVLDPPRIVCQAIGTCVTPAHLQRG